MPAARPQDGPDANWIRAKSSEVDQRHRRSNPPVATDPKEWVFVPVPGLVDEALFRAAQEQLQENRNLAAGQINIGLRLYVPHEPTDPVLHLLPWSSCAQHTVGELLKELGLSLIHISEPTRRTPTSYAVFCLKTN